MDKKQMREMMLGSEILSMYESGEKLVISFYKEWDLGLAVIYYDQGDFDFWHFQIGKTVYETNEYDVEGIALIKKETGVIY